MKISELFASEVTREIPPVVYFHEDDPQMLANEVSEYIITGGWPEASERAKRVGRGIHEHYVRLMTKIAAQLDSGLKAEPASWISGFYGSGKSSFAKLLGLSLDGRTLPDGTALSEAWLGRNMSPRSAEMRDAWQALTKSIDPISIVFDIGGKSRGAEHVHETVVRELQKRLNYSKTSAVADREIKLERDGHYEAFLAQCKETLGEDWSQVRHRAMADDEFSAVMHAQFPKLYPDEQAWVIARDAEQSNEISASDAVEAIRHMLQERAEGKTLFIVIDEVSQYIFQDEGRMLKLQALASELKERMKGQVWLLATGQQKLDDQNDASVLNKMKDRFPESLRVHLDSTNIRDVVHRRLLHKKPEHEKTLRALYQTHGSSLRLFGYGCEDLTEADFVEVYPMLPKQFDLILRVTSGLKSRSRRTQGDDHNIRGLLGMLGELFREQGLAEREVGELITLDQVYEVQKSALDADTSNTMMRVLEHCTEQGLELAARAAKAVVLLQLLTSDDGKEPVTSRLVAQCLYQRLDEGDNEPAVREALEALRAANLLGYSEKTGYKLQSSAGQDWEKERTGITVPHEDRFEYVLEALGELMGDVDGPKLKGVAFKWQALFSTENTHRDHVLRGSREASPLTVDFRLVPKAAQDDVTWVNRSAESDYTHRLMWVAGNYEFLLEAGRELGRSKRMLARKEAQRASLNDDERRLLSDEKTREEELRTSFKQQVADAFMAGQMYFAGGSAEPASYGAAFRPALLAAGTARLPHIYSAFVPTRVTLSELEQLVKTELDGPAQKFFGDELGILGNDAGRMVATCDGEVPRQVFRQIERYQGYAGSSLLATLARPPYGYDTNVVKASVAGLLRARKIRVRLSSGVELAYIKDSGKEDLFKKDREFKAAEFLPAGEQKVKGKDCRRIAKMFDETFGISVDPDPEPIADRLGPVLKQVAERLREVESLLNRLPERPETPVSLAKLHKAMEDCLYGKRTIEDRVLAAVKHLDALRDGVAQLDRYHTHLTDETVDEVGRALAVTKGHLAQLHAVGEVPAELQDCEKAVADQLGRERPWEEIGAIGPALDEIRAAYREARQRRIDEEAKLAETVRSDVKRAPGFANLGTDDRHEVLRPIAKAHRETTSEQLHPSLEMLSAGLTERFEQARADALERLDGFHTKKTGEVIVRVHVEVRDRVIGSASDVDALLEEIRSKLLAELEHSKGKIRVQLK